MNCLCTIKTFDSIHIGHLNLTHIINTIMIVTYSARVRYSAIYYFRVCGCVRYSAIYYFRVCGCEVLKTVLLHN